MRHTYLSWILLLVVLAGSQSVFAVQTFREFFFSVQSEAKGHKASKLIKDLKDAGMSYQPSLVAPIDQDISCKSTEQRQALAGIALFDVSYALMFGKAENFAKTWKFLQAEVKMPLRPETVALLGKMARTSPAELLKPETLKNYAKDMEKESEHLIDTADKDPVARAWIVQIWYGSTLEALYVGSNLAVASGNDSKLVAIGNELLVRLQLLDRYLEFEEKAGTAQYPWGDRRAGIRPAITLLKEKSGKLDANDFRKLVEIVKPVRDGYTKPCGK